MGFKAQRAKGLGANSGRPAPGSPGNPCCYSRTQEQGEVLSAALPPPPWWGWLFPGVLTHFPFCRGAAAVPCQEEDSAGRPSLGKHPSTLWAWRAKANSKHAPEMKRERSLISFGSKCFPNPGAPLERKGRRAREEEPGRISDTSIRLIVPLTSKWYKAVGEEKLFYSNCKWPRKNVKNTLQGERLRD